MYKQELTWRCQNKMNVKARRKTTFGMFGKLWEDDSALGLTSGIIGSILGLAPFCVSCLQNCFPFGVVCGCGNCACFPCCACTPFAWSAWITDALEFCGCGLTGWLGGVFSEIAGTLIALASGGGDITSITSYFR